MNDEISPDSFLCFKIWVPSDGIITMKSETNQPKNLLGVKKRKRFMPNERQPEGGGRGEPFLEPEPFQEGALDFNGESP